MKTKTTLLIVSIALLIVACKREQDAPICVAGSGGNVTIVVYANHGNTAIPNYATHGDTAFVKYGATVIPGTGPANYDTFFIGEPGEDHIHCENLKCGNYYVYRTVWDSVANVSRYGGSAIHIFETNGEKDIIISVN
jgi:hypothetical protein